jgi:hypothetical protein
MTERKSFWRDQGFLVLGVALPLLVVAFFLVARWLPARFVDPPRHPLLFVAHGTPRGQGLPISGSVSVHDGRIRVRWTKIEGPSYDGGPRVFRFDAASERLEELSVPEPEDPAALEGSVDLFLDAPAPGTRLETAPRAPDGWAFEVTPWRSSGLLGELFGGRGREPRAIVKKDGRVIALPRTDATAYSYGTVSFLGWIVPAAEPR